MKYHDTFGKIAVFAGAVLFYKYPREWVRTEGNAAGELANFGNPDQTENTDRNPRYLIRQTETLNKKEGTNHLPQVYMTCGMEDHLLGANEALAGALSDTGAEVERHPVPGSHDFAFCNDQLPAVLNWFAPKTSEKS